MRYAEYRDAIRRELRGARDGLTWAKLKQRLDLPYNVPCPEWTRRLEEEIGLRVPWVRAPAARTGGASHVPTERQSDGEEEAPTGNAPQRLR